MGWDREKDFNFKFMILGTLAAMASKVPTYVFRGTTKGFPGNKNSMEIPYACTRRNRNRQEFPAFM